MKSVLFITLVALLSACGTPQMSPEQEKVRPISNADGCKFIKTAYFEVSHPNRMHYYAAKNVVAAGGNAYQVMSTGKDMAVGVQIHTNNIGIYSCN